MDLKTAQEIITAYGKSIESSTAARDSAMPYHGRARLLQRQDKGLGACAARAERKQAAGVGRGADPVEGGGHPGRDGIQIYRDGAFGNVGQDVLRCPRRGGESKENQGGREQREN